MNRQKLERTIVTRLVSDILKAGYRVAVSLERGYDIDEMLIGSRDAGKIVEAALSGDECHIFIHSANGPVTENGHLVSDGWVYLVYGNDGWDVISDYTIGIENILTGALALSDKLSD